MNQLSHGQEWYPNQLSHGQEWYPNQLSHGQEWYPNYIYIYLWDGFKFYLDMRIAIYMQCHFKYQDVCCLRNVNCMQISKEIKNREQFILKSGPEICFSCSLL